jgi:signal transduction histidine kinase
MSPDALDQLRAEIVELRALQERLVLAADADRQQLERELHEGVQQHLVALAVNLQLADSLLESNPVEAKKLVKEMGRDVQQALNEAAQLAQRIYAPLLEASGFAAALRAAAAGAGIAASVEVSADSTYPPELMHTVYSCWLEALQSGSSLSISVQEEPGALTFEIVRDTDRRDASLDRLGDRVHALGGKLTIEGTRVSGSLPLTR